MTDPREALARLRAELDALDGELVDMAARRQAIVAEIGHLKRSHRQPTRDYSREREVRELARERAARRGLDPDLGERLVGAMIEASLTSQERERLEALGAGGGRSALVIGGAGRMGRWFTEFLATQGWAVGVSDPAGAVPGLPWHEDWREPARTAELVIVAAPLAATAAILEELVALQPRGLVIEIGSIKAPVAGPLANLRAAGVAVASIHPMFGPDVRLLAGRHVILVDIGAPQAQAAARALFEQTSAGLAEMSLEQHDRLVAWVLGLSHATNIAFFTALAGSGRSIGELAAFASTTFGTQLGVAARVAQENPELYFEIQSTNPHGIEPLQALAAAAAAVERTVAAGDAAGFAALMRAGAAYLEEPRS
ncbi:MAG: prephenate dehydrogenase/arogenate dehydrogenase family protein [Gammaproteobacteria bacterium]